MTSLRKVSSLALAAAMTAGLGATPVFAAPSEKETGPVTTKTGVTIATDDTKDTNHYVTLYDKAGKPLATTSETHTLYDEDDNVRFDYDQKIGDPQYRNVVDVNLADGAVKAFTTQTGDADSNVTWDYASNDSAGETALVRFKDGTVTVDDNVKYYQGNEKKSFDWSTDTDGVVTLYVYPTNAVTTKHVVKTAFTKDDENYAVGTPLEDAFYNTLTEDEKKNVEDKKTLDKGDVVELNLHVFEPDYIDLNFTNKDTVYTIDDEATVFSKYFKTKAVDDTKTTSNTDNATTDLDGTKHSAAELAEHGSTKVNHLLAGDSATVKATIVGEDENSNEVSDHGDYNKKLAFRYVDQGLGKNSQESYAKVTPVADTNTANVTIRKFYNRGSRNSNFYAVYAVHEWNVTESKSESVNDNATTTSGALRSGVLSIGTDEAAVYRMYNPNSYEHFYTTNASERDNLIAAGWNYESIGWYAPAKSNEPVYRVYNSNNGGEHLYTTNADEVKNLVKAGWNDEGVAFYSASNEDEPVYRDYNPNEVARNHNYTADSKEHKYLDSLGWNNEGVAFNAIRLMPDMD